MSLFGLQKEEGIEKQKDTVGGFQAKPSGLYKGIVKCLYVTQAKSGAKGLVLEMDLEDGSKYKETMYFTSGTAKGGKHFTENNGVKRFLPGYNFSNAFIRLLKGKDIFDLVEDDVEKILVKQKVDGKDENVEVMGLTDVKGKEVILGLQRVIENGSKNVNGKWVATNDKRTNNSIDAIFNANGLTANEFEVNPEAAPEFLEEWKKANEGKDRNKFKEVAGAPAGGASGGDAGGSTGGAGKSLFG